MTNMEEIGGSLVIVKAEALRDVGGFNILDLIERHASDKIRSDVVLNPSLDLWGGPEAKTPNGVQLYLGMEMPDENFLSLWAERIEDGHTTIIAQIDFDYRDGAWIVEQHDGHDQSLGGLPERQQKLREIIQMIAGE